MSKKKNTNLVAELKPQEDLLYTTLREAADSAQYFQYWMFENWTHQPIRSALVDSTLRQFWNNTERADWMFGICESCAKPSLIRYCAGLALIIAESIIPSCTNPSDPLCVAIKSAKDFANDPVDIRSIRLAYNKVDKAVSNLDKSEAHHLAVVEALKANCDSWGDEATPRMARNAARSASDVVSWAVKAAQRDGVTHPNYAMWVRLCLPLDTLISCADTEADV